MGIDTRELASNASDPAPGSAAWLWDLEDTELRWPLPNDGRRGYFDWTWRRKLKLPRPGVAIDIDTSSEDDGVMMC